MVSGIIELIKLLPVLIAAIKALLSMAGSIKDRVDKREDERKIEDEKQSAHNGGRPGSN